MRETWQRYKWLVLLAVGVIVIAVGFYGYLLHRANAADSRAERYRQVICGILAEPFSGEVPASIENGRHQFARPGHPHECEPRPGLIPKPQIVHVTINGKPGVIVVNPPRTAPSTSPQPAPTSPRATATASPGPHPTRSPSPRPTPKPSPSPTCVKVNPLHRSVCIA